jgi:hypothetical protein
MGSTDMGAVIEREAGPGADDPARPRARDRILQRHSRSRRELLAAVERLAERTEVGMAEAAAMRDLVRRLLRCQRKEDPRV